jgi:biopolymer transport protein ExbD
MAMVADASDKKGGTMHTNRRSRRRSTNPAKLQMSAMIDVVFLLLIFFIATLRPVDLLAELGASRMQPENKPPSTRIDLLEIQVTPQGYLANGRHTSLDRIEKAASLLPPDGENGILVISYDDAPHGMLIDVLDVFAKADFRNISVMSR